MALMKKIKKHILAKGAYLDSSMQYNNNIRQVIGFHNLICLLPKESN